MMPVPGLRLRVRLRTCTRQTFCGGRSSGRSSGFVVAKRHINLVCNVAQPGRLFRPPTSSVSTSTCLQMGVLGVCSTGIQKEVLNVLEPRNLPQGLIN